MNKKNMNKKKTDFRRGHPCSRLGCSVVFYVLYQDPGICFEPGSRSVYKA